MKRQNFKRAVSFFLAVILLLGAFSTVAAVAVTDAFSAFLAYPDSNNYWIVFYDADYDLTVLATGYVEDPAQYGEIGLYFDGAPDGMVSVPVENINCYSRQGDSWVSLSNYALPSDVARRVIAANVNVYDSARCLYRAACTYGAFAESQRQLAAGSDFKYGELVGVYEGTYSAPQGVTGVTLSVYETAALLSDTATLTALADVATRCGLDASGAPEQSFSAAQIADVIRTFHNGDYVAFFNFYPVYANPGVEEGLYMMSVSYNSVSDTFDLVGEAWIRHDTYVMADLRNVSLGNGAILGDVYSEAFLGYGKVGELQAQIGTDMTWTETESHAGVQYTDRYFSESAFYYNHELAKLTLCLEMASFTADSEENWGLGVSYDPTDVDAAYNTLVRDRCANLIKAYHAMGFDTQRYYNYDVRLSDASDKVAFSVATKQEVCGATLVAVVIRGGGYGGEWSSNFNVEYGSLYHTGFRTAALGVYNQVMKEISEIDGELKFWVTGFSRGAAVANLLAAELNDYALESDRYTNEDVYAYTFATPQGVTADMDASDPYYSNIFNIVNPGDIVPLVAPSAWGYTRYGVTRTFSATTYESGAVNADVFEKVNASYKTLTGEKLDSQKNYGQQALNQAILSILCSAFPTPREAEPFLAFLQEFLELSNTKRKDLLGNWKEIDTDEKIAILRERYGEESYWIARGKATLFWDSMPSGVLTELLRIAGKDLVLYVLTLAEIHGIGGQQMVDLLDALGNALGGWFQLLTSEAELYHVFNFLQGHDPALYLAWMMQPEYQAFGQGYVPPTVVVSVACPVNVTVYHGDTVVASVVEHHLVESQIPVVLDGETASFYFPTVWENDYRIEITPTATGSMTYTVTELDVAGGVVGRANYYEIPLEQGQTFVSEVESLTPFSADKYDLTRTDSEGETVISADETSDAGEWIMLDVTVAGEGSVFGAGVHQKGDTVCLTAYPAGNATFTGWYSAGELVCADATYRLTLTERTVLEAVFAAGEGYLVVLNANDGSGDVTALSGVAAGDMPLPACPFDAPDGMVFDGWSSGATGAAMPAGSLQISEDTVLYALWKEAPEAPDDPVDDPIEAPATQLADAPSSAATRPVALFVILGVGGGILLIAVVLIVKRRF